MHVGTVDVDILKIAQVYFTALPLVFASFILFKPKEFMEA
jgi:hypothetical protein